MCGAVDLNSIFVSIMLCTSTGFCWSIERVRGNKEADHEELLRIVSTYLNIISQKSPLHSLYFQHLYSTDWGCKPWNKRNQWSHPEKGYWHKSLKYSFNYFHRIYIGLVHDHTSRPPFMKIFFFCWRQGNLDATTDILQIHCPELWSSWSDKT